VGFSYVLHVWALANQGRRGVFFSPSSAVVAGSSVLVSSAEAERGSAGAFKERGSWGSSVRMDAGCAMLSL